MNSLLETAHESKLSDNAAILISLFGLITYRLQSQLVNLFDLYIVHNICDDENGSQDILEDL